MSIDAATLVLFDASCLVAAAGSPSGGSGFLLDTCRRGFLQAAVSPQVLVEAERNIRGKLTSAALGTFRSYLVTTPIRIVELLVPSVRMSFESIVGAKDEHVLAAAIQITAPFLLTLDQLLAHRVNDARLPVRAFLLGNSWSRCCLTMWTISRFDEPQPRA